MTSPDVEAIVADIGGSAMLAIKALGERWRSSHSRKSQPFFSFHLVAPDLCEMRMMTGKGYFGVRQYRLTPLGQQVRAHILSREPNP